jgi:hypothetical protein
MWTRVNHCHASAGRLSNALLLDLYARDVRAGAPPSWSVDYFNCPKNRRIFCSSGLSMVSLSDASVIIEYRYLRLTVDTSDRHRGGGERS